MKKLISIFLSVAIIMSSLTCFAATKSEGDIAALLSELDIMKGDPNGNLRLDDYVSRSEFTKVAIAASAYRDMVASNLSVSPFKDVLYSHWAAPYIKLAVLNNICKGYPDGTFNPDGTVLYEEAVTMLLKVLGYTDNDFGNSWPYGQIGIAKKTGLCDDIDKNIGDPMTRRDVMFMLYNLLNTNAKGTNIDYINTLDYKIVEDTILVATSKEDSSVGSDKVFTSNGLFKINSNFNYDNVGKKGDVVIKNGDELVSFIPSEQEVTKYDIYQVLDNDVVVLEGGQLKTLDADNSLAVYNKSAKSTLQGLLKAISPGDILTTYKNSNGSLDYGIIKTDELQGPYTVHSSNWTDDIGLTGNLTVMRDGVKNSKDSISVNDIIYYSKPLGVVWAYNNKVTGIYEKALPNKDMPTSVVVSGVTYPIEGVDAFNKLSSNGSFNYGDTITMLMGKTNQVADVVTPSNTGEEVVGYLFDTGIKELTDSKNLQYTNSYIKVATPDGGVFEYTADRDYNNIKNSVVKLNFSGGVAKATTISTQSSIYGEFNWGQMKLGNYNVSSDVDILDVTTLIQSEVGNGTKVFPQRIDGLNLNTKDILYAETKNNEITKLILNDVTGDAYTYGIVTKSPKGTNEKGVVKTYSFDIGKGLRTIQSTSLYNVLSGQPAEFVFAPNGTAGTIKGLTRIDGIVSNINTTSLTAGGENYLISDKVLVFEQTGDYNYLLLPLSDVLGNNKYSLTAYYDKPISDGGRVRVILATEK